MSNIKVTVFTPTYNRHDKIHILYDSLKNQSNKSFEWIIVDDGKDETEKVVSKFHDEADFPIRYYRPGGERGISRAMNLMVQKANGYLVMKVDDDDILTEDAIESVIQFEETIRPLKESFAGVSGLRSYKDGRIIGEKWRRTESYIDATNFERKQYGLNGDKAEAYYLEVLKKFGPIPTVPGEYYTWESVLWDRIAHAGLKLRWFNKVIYITEYLPDGATANRVEARAKNFGTYTILISEKLSYKEVPLVQRLILSCRYFELARKMDMSFSDLRNEFSNCRIIARIGFFSSFFTRMIPQRNKTY